MGFKQFFTVTSFFLIHSALFLGISFSFPAQAYFQRDFLKAKAQKNSSSQWTLGDWLSQKKKMSLMDHWLAMNSSSHLLEFNVSAGLGRVAEESHLGATNMSSGFDLQSYRGEIFLTLFHLAGEFEKTSKDAETYGGAAGLRLIGKSSQTTGLIARYGLRHRTDLESKDNFEIQSVEGVLQIYILSGFGFQGKYRRDLVTQSQLHTEYEGSRSTFGLFVEYGLLRIYGDYYTEPQKLITSSGVKTTVDLTGLEYGLKFHF